jgi:hypothetical protein
MDKEDILTYRLGGKDRIFCTYRILLAALLGNKNLYYADKDEVLYFACLPRSRADSFIAKPTDFWDNAKMKKQDVLGSAPTDYFMLHERRTE